jgi:hypothetical protein
MDRLDSSHLHSRPSHNVASFHAPSVNADRDEMLYMEAVVAHTEAMLEITRGGAHVSHNSVLTLDQPLRPR